jgi:microcystin-dependent protein
MAGLFSRLKIWNPGESLTASDLNGEFNHFLSNIDAEHSEGYSANLSEMQAVENPGGLGSENLTQPISLADEIQRLRFVINRIVGKTQWYETPSESIEGLNNTISGILDVKSTRIVDGEKSTISGFPKFLQANGASGVRLNASTGVPFSCFIDASSFSFTSNISSGALSAQPLNNTATLASSLGGGQASREATEFTISSVGSSISTSVGKQQIFSIVNGGNTEYFLGTITSATTISGIKRGYFYDSSNLPVSPIALTTGHTITMLRTTYVFLKTNGTLVVSYNPPTYNGSAPVSASINDYWYDIVNNTWKYYNGNWVVADAIYVGMCAQGTTNTVCARSDDFFVNFSSINGLKIREVTNTSVSTRNDETANISVYGSVIRSDFKDYIWDITQNLLPGETETSSTNYYLYLNRLGVPYMSFIAPINELARFGYYHPNEALRCVGYLFNDQSSNLIGPATEFVNVEPQTLALTPTGTISAYGGSIAPNGYLLCDGSAVSRGAYSSLFNVIGTSFGNGDGTNTFNVPDLRYTFMRGRGAAISVTGSGSASSNNATFTNHGVNRTGLRVRLSSGTLSGLAGSTNYFAIVVDANTLAFASSYANAIAGTKIAISGTNSAVIVQWEDPDISTRLQAAVGGNTGANVGTRQDDQNLSHSHGGNQFLTNNSGTGILSTGAFIGNASIPASGGEQANPRNVYVNYIIKF